MFTLQIDLFEAFHCRAHGEKGGGRKDGGACGEYDRLVPEVGDGARIEHAERRHEVYGEFDSQHDGAYPMSPSSAPQPVLCPFRK